MEDPSMDDGDGKRESKIAPAKIAVHPTQESVAMAVGADLRIFNLREGFPVILSEAHKDSIRAIRYGAMGKLFASAGDDKLVKIWETDSRRCIYTVVSEKRVSAVTISNDGLFVCFAGKIRRCICRGYTRLH